MLIAEDAREGLRTPAWKAEPDCRYACPECGNQVLLKVGPIIVPHFAHRPMQSCGYGEGETYAHIYMKHQLTRWWPSVELEVPEIIPGHRADGVLSNQGRCFAIECQATPISPEEWDRRTKDYWRAGLPLLWIWRVNLLTEHHPPREYRIPASALWDSEQKNNRLVIFSQPGELALWRLIMPRREPVYVREVRKTRIAAEGELMPLPKPWSKERQLWVEPPVPREFSAVVEDPLIQYALKQLGGSIVGVRPTEDPN